MTEARVACPPEVRVQPLAGTLGAAVEGVDLNDLDDETFAVVHRAWLDHVVLFFPGQQLSPEGHVRFAQRFGEVELHPLTEKLDEDHPEITLLHSDRGGRADVWHSDVPFSATPPKAAILHCITSPTEGGDTMWSNQYAAYEAMSPPIKEMVERLTAVHSAWSQGRPDLEHEHPVVRTHPETGRRSLYVNRLFTSRIPQLHPDESRSLLEHLWRWAEQPEFTCRWRWHPGDVAIWDNRCSMHYAIGDYDGERIMQRVTVVGDTPHGDSVAAEHYPQGPLSASTALHRRP